MAVVRPLHATRRVARQYTPAIRVLIVCTGNVCRSPMAAAFLRRRLDDLHIAVDVRSAGLLDEGRPAIAEAIAVASDYGVDLSGHASQRTTPELLAESDLVLGMALEHVREAVALLPDVWPRTFTLKELISRATRVGSRAPNQPIGDWLRQASGDRDTTDLLRAHGEQDVADPTGGPPAGFHALAEELDSSLHQLVPLVWSA